MDQQPLITNDGGIHPVVIGYKHRQCGCLWIILLLSGIAGIISFASSIVYTVGIADDDFDSDTSSYSYSSEESYSYTNNDSLIQAVLFICWGIATMWVQMEDRGDFVLLTYGPCRWLLCGMGKEKIYYRQIRDYQISKSCFYGFGIPCCTSIKLFNTCSCCCGDGGVCCGHKTVKLTIKERPQGEHAIDEDSDCCAERCCLRCCCGENGEYCGKGCCCQPICNPCDANFCMMNTIFVSTNDPDGFMRLLQEKVGEDRDGTTFVTI
mmetsp:Transcript_13839/g.21691  ORF Transcript_13839/g.21691 Transcript_13839/m.21691 type:complete len:265 (+) Transcript_13839:20-814(+)